LLAPLAETLPPEPTRSDRNQRLLQLPLYGGVVGAEERNHPEQGVLEPQELTPQQRNGDDTEHDEMADSRASDEQDDPHGQREHQRDRKVRLEDREQIQHANHHQDRQQTLRQAAHLVALLHHQHGRPDDDRQLAKLRWLHGGAENEASRPMAYRGNGSREGQHGDQHERDRQEYERPGQLPEPFRIHLGGDPERHHAHADAKGLTTHEEPAGVIILHGNDGARAVQEGQAEHCQRRREHHEGPRLDAHGPPIANLQRHGHHVAPPSALRASRVNVRPRSS
jgi:hypothetical protein